MVEKQSGCRDKICPTAAAIKLLQPKWTLQIVYELQNGARRFNELTSNIEGVNPRTLSQRLRELEECRIIARSVLATVPPWVEYSLTEKGRALSGVMESISSWAQKWGASP